MSQRAPAQPPAPDPRATAQAQAEFNSAAARENAQLNRVDQITPQGSLTYGRNAQFDTWLNDKIQEDRVWRQNTGQDFNEAASREWFSQRNPNAEFTATVALSPEQQELYNQTVQGQRSYGNIANRQLQELEGRGSFQFDGAGTPLQARPDFTGIGDPNQSREAVQGALMSRINPDLERERAALESRLANQGITMGSEAWNTGMQDWQRMANDARFGAILNAGQEQSRVFGLGMGQAQMGNAARQQSLQEQLALRSQPINEAASLLTGQMVQNPQFQNVPQVMLQAPDYQGAVGQNYAGQISNWNSINQRIGAENAAIANALGQAGGMGASMAMKFSDRRLKRNVQRIGTGTMGLPLYRFQYLWGEQGEGYMADEVASVAPHAVVVGAGGFAMVDYSALA